MVSLHEAPPEHPSEEEAAAFERILLESLRSELHRWGRDAPGTVERLELRGSRPDTELVLHYRGHDGEPGAASVGIWDEHWHFGPGDRETPAGLGGVISSNWADGSIRQAAST
jgi:hypothetical protein